MALLQQVLAGRPEDQKARVSLGVLAAQAKQFDLAIHTLLPVLAWDPPWRSVGFYTLAYSYRGRGDRVAAEHYGRLAQQYAQTQQERGQADQLLRALARSDGKR